jgi:hypothetical protein
MGTSLNLWFSSVPLALLVIAEFGVDSQRWEYFAHGILSCSKHHPSATLSISANKNRAFAVLSG